MPTPRRYFPVSREINDDHELWEFTEEFTDRALRFWLEILSILDRNDNRVSIVDNSVDRIARTVRQTPASGRRMVGWLLARGWLEVAQLAADGSPAIASSPNFWKYHKTPGGSQVPRRLPPTDRPTDHKRRGVSTPGDNSENPRISKQEAEDILTRLNLSPKVLEDV